MSHTGHFDPAGGPTLFEWADLGRIGGLLGGAVASCFIPERADPAWIGLLDWVTRRLRPAAVREIAARMHRALGEDAASDWASLARGFWRMQMEDAWGRSRGMRAMGWRPHVRIEGLDRLDAALSRGRGAILWGMRFASATAIKQAFYYADRPLVHLSRARHGSPSDSRIGLQVAAPLYCRAENPYLRERVVIPLDGSPRYLQLLRKRLAANACVSIFGEHAGRQNVVRPVLGMKMEFAVGAPSLAWTEQSALMTVSAHREAPFCYRVEIDQEIPVDRSIERKGYAEQAVTEFASRLEARIRRYPADWQGWAYRNFTSCETSSATGVS
jgi:lauroyl/myristoyl acyltransferase